MYNQEKLKKLKKLEKQRNKRSFFGGFWLEIEPVLTNTLQL